MAKGIVSTDELNAAQGAGSLLDQLRSQPREETFEDAMAWIPVMADEGLEGNVVGITQYHDTAFGNDRLLRSWIVEDDNGARWSIIPFAVRLAKQMAIHRAEVGDRVALLYLGEFTSPTDPNTQYKDYAIARTAAARQRRQQAARIMTPDAFAEKSN
jgi:hypothetical protein